MIFEDGNDSCNDGGFDDRTMMVMVLRMAMVTVMDMCVMMLGIKTWAMIRIFMSAIRAATVFIVMQSTPAMMAMMIRRMALTRFATRFLFMIMPFGGKGERSDYGKSAGTGVRLVMLMTMLRTVVMMLFTVIMAMIIDVDDAGNDYGHDSVHRHDHKRITMRAR